MKAAADRDPVLESLERVLLEYRDEAVQEMEQRPLSHDYYWGQRDGIRLALAALHSRTDGAYGKPWTDQTEGQ
jgi:hypothetical protein